MPTPTERQPPTPEQRAQLREDLALVEARLDDISVLMRACYGEESQVAIRAEEVAGALQRFRRELDQMAPRAQAAG